jgi:hypothetical protein
MLILTLLLFETIITLAYLLHLVSCLFTSHHTISSMSCIADAILHGVETRTSAPVQITRKSDTLECSTLAGLYPTGEGAGYAGGIVVRTVIFPLPYLLSHPSSLPIFLSPSPSNTSSSPLILILHVVLLLRLLLRFLRICITLSISLHFHRVLYCVPSSSTPSLSIENTAATSI